MLEQSTIRRGLILLLLGFCIMLLIVNTEYRSNNYFYKNRLSYYKEYEETQLNTLGTPILSAIESGNSQWRIYFNFANMPHTSSLAEIDSLYSWMKKYVTFDVYISGNFDDYIIEYVNKEKELHYKIAKLIKPETLKYSTWASVYIINTDGTCIYNWVLDEEQANKSLLHLEAFRRLYQNNNELLH
ncbi:hypothetical protein KAJ27_10030 [bacterium]|nr:hypothetical protein [Candidatus Neomarinimicrobiota bacterium]MCK5684451.1 hypothetical protein [bacterium]